ncbi:MAG: hypothetical protein HY298_23170 [Verrucomicrobia bacterium]|nr:hypothetical protein [Verrucomicrobiota bacterium]
MQTDEPLTLTLSPSDGERERIPAYGRHAPFGDSPQRRRSFTLSPSDGERAGVRGVFNCIVTAKGWTPNCRGSVWCPPFRVLRLQQAVVALPGCDGLKASSKQ